MRITEKIRDKIALHLPKGYAEIIAKQCDCSVATVYRVLHQDYENDAVAEALILLAKQTKDEKEKKHKQLTKIAEQL